MEPKFFSFEEINQNELISKKCKKVSTVLNYFDLISTVTECYSIFAFASLVGSPIGITSSAVRLKTYVITAWVSIKKYKTINKKKKKKYPKMVLLAKSKLNRTEILISKVLIDSNISHDEFVLINNVLKEFCNMKEETKKSDDK